ncbi:protein of unknown function [Clostridium beijerinckii]|nr:protein of unknown function [Clostridium beijerinckii]
MHIDLMYIKYNKAKNNILCEMIKPNWSNMKIFLQYNIKRTNLRSLLVASARSR